MYVYNNSNNNLTGLNMSERVDLARKEVLWKFLRVI